MVSWYFALIILFDLRKHIDTSKIFNFNEMLTFMTTFCEIWNQKAKGAVCASLERSPQDMENVQWDF